MKLTISWIGQPKQISTRFGTKQKNSIKAYEHQNGEAYLDYWVNNQNQNWKVGDVVEVDAITPRMYNGKTYYDIVMPKLQRGMPSQDLLVLNQKLDTVTAQLRQVIDHLAGRNRLDLTSNGTKVPDFSELDNPPIDDINPDDIPFA